MRKITKAQRVKGVKGLNGYSQSGEDKGTAKEPEENEALGEREAEEGRVGASEVD